MAAEKKVTTVTLKDLAASLAETHGVAKSQMNGILAGMVEDLGKHLKKGARIRISGLGNPASAEAPGAHGSQSRHRRGHQDQSQQEDCVPGLEGPQGNGDVGRDAIVDMPWAPLWRGLCITWLPAFENGNSTASAPITAMHDAVGMTLPDPRLTE